VRHYRLFCAIKHFDHAKTRPEEFVLKDTLKILKYITIELTAISLALAKDGFGGRRNGE
jgi:hypothetical protein